MRVLPIPNELDNSNHPLTNEINSQKVEKARFEPRFKNVPERALSVEVRCDSK